MKIKLLPLSLAIVLSAATSALAGPISGTVQFSAYAVSMRGSHATDDQSASWLDIPASVSANASATSIDGAGRPTTVFSNGSATWASNGLSGTFDMTWGWNAVNATSVDTRGGVTNWSYTFLADTTGWFTLNCNIEGTGNVFGLWGLYANSNLDSLSGSLPYNSSDPSGTGTIVGGLTAGHVYTVSLYNNGNIGGININNKGSATAHVDWSIKPVPETCSTLLLLGSALAAVLGLRRKLRT